MLKIKTGDKIYANLILYNFGIFLANEAAKENDKKTRKKSNKYQYSVDISTSLKLSRKYFIRKESDKKMDIISLIAKHVHAVKTLNTQPQSLLIHMLYHKISEPYPAGIIDLYKTY